MPVPALRPMLVAGLAVLSSVATAQVDYSFDLKFQNLMVHADRSTAPSVSFDVTNTGSQPHDFVVKVQLSFVRDATPVLLEGHDLAPGATQSFTIASTDLRAGWNQLGYTLLQDGNQVANTYQEYRKEVPGGLPDLKIVHARRLGVGVYAFEVKNVGKAESGAYSAGYRLDNLKWFDASPAPAPSLAPGRSLAFTVRDLPEHVANPRKDRFDVHIAVDEPNRIPESNEDNNGRTTGYGYKGPWAERHP
jgi:hypothetical protein